MTAAEAVRERRLVGRLRDGDEAAFSALVRRHHAGMVRLARCYVGDAAEEVAQAAWVGMLEGIGRFEERSSVRTWLFRILLNIAREEARRRGCSVPFSAVSNDAEAPMLDRASWARSVHDDVADTETTAAIRASIAALPPQQRAVIHLRDVLGFTAAEVCELLGLSPGNQRVVLHRARARVCADYRRLGAESGPIAANGVG